MTALVSFTDLLEALMILCSLAFPGPFPSGNPGFPAPQREKSLFFEFFIWIGYIFGIVRKVILWSAGAGEGWLFYLSWFFYVLNIVEISIDMALYFRNVRLDKEKAQM